MVGLGVASRVVSIFCSSLGPHRAQFNIFKYPQLRDEGVQQRPNLPSPSKKLKKDSIVFFFPADKATINGYGITAREWKQFSKIQKKKFISEAVKEIETRESVSVTEKNLDKISAILDAGVKKLGKGDSSPMIGMLLQMLKASNYTKKNEGQAIF